MRVVDAASTVAEVRALHGLARAAGLRLWFPMLLYGGAGVISAPLLQWAPPLVHQAWWGFIAVTAPMAILWYYRRRTRLHGVGIGPRRAARYVVFGEVLALALFLTPEPIGMSISWLGLSIGAVWVARRWRQPGLYVVAVGVAVLVLGCPFVPVSVPLTDLLVGLWVCGCTAVIAGTERRGPRRLAAVPRDMGFARIRPARG